MNDTPRADNASTDTGNGPTETMTAGTPRTRQARGRTIPLQIVVLGMHRSGTSALTGALSAMGVHVGDDNEVTAPSWQNPKGFFERRDARRLCDALLHRSGADWWKVSSFDPDNANFEAVTDLRPQIADLVGMLNERGDWALKEPRLCHLLPIFQSALQNPFAVITARNPVEIARSLRRRNGFPLQAGLALWEAYTVAMVRHGLKLDHTFVDFDRLTSDPAATLSELAAELQARGVAGLDLDAGIASIEPGLRRETFDADTDRGLMTPAQTSLWKAFTQRQFKKTPSLSAAATGVLREFESDYERAETARKSLELLNAEVRQLQQSKKELRSSLESSREDIKAAKDEAKAARKDQARLKAQTDELRGKLEEVRKKNEALKSDLARAKKAELKAQQTEIRLGELREKLAGARSDIAAQKKTAAELAGRLALAQSRIALTQSRLERLQSGPGMRLARRLTGMVHRAANLVAGLPSPAGRSLLRSPLFDSAWYTDRYPDIAASSLAPLRHYLRWGGKEGRDPHPLFDTHHFLAQLDGQASDPPLLHYLAMDPLTAPSPHPLFDGAAYLAGNPDVAEAGLHPLEHYVRHGGHEGRQPHPCFDGQWYLSVYPDIAAEKINPLVHYLTRGAAEERDPSPDFSTRDYLQAHPGLLAAGINPLVHHVLSGRSTPVMPSALARAQSDAAALSLLARTRSFETAGSPFHNRLASFDQAKGPEGWRQAIDRSEAGLQSVEAELAQKAETPLVSIIMPTFNRAGIIGEAISSICWQTYTNWELWVCDDASTDETEAAVAAFGDARIRYVKLPKGGAAAARNAGLGRATGELIAYLDSDNIWHPKFLSRMVLALSERRGHFAAYSDYLDFEVLRGNEVKIRSIAVPEFDHERLLGKNYIDLNTFVHRKELFDIFGGFDEALTRRQDYALIKKYTWLRDPLHVRSVLALYRRDKALNQITHVSRSDLSCVPLIEDTVERYLREGLPLPAGRPVRRVTILAWDMCRNHASKPFALAEALSRDYSVQLVAFRFFDEPIFPPLEGVEPGFDTVYFDGRDFPDFFSAFRAALDVIDGELIYAVKPRLPSLGLALLANAKKGTPILLEANDLETVVRAPSASDRHADKRLDDADLGDPGLLSPHSELWSQLMDSVAGQLPVTLTHNLNLDRHYGWRSLYMRNVKDEAVYDPALYDRDAIRSELGFAPGDRVILFGGLLRKHKGIYELVELVEWLEDPRYKLLFAGSRPTPDQKKLVERYADAIRVLPPQSREAMARLNLAADLVIIWLDPDVPASHYQMPYKATDAFAMGAAVIANPISDLETLGRQGYLRLADYGDWDAITASIRALFDDPEECERMRLAARRLYQRQFSYAAARSVFELAASRALKQPGPLPAALAFTERFNAFYKQATNAADDFVVARAPAPEADGPVRVIDVQDIDRFSLSDPDAVAILLPARSCDKARETAEFLLKRAGMPAHVIIIRSQDGPDDLDALNAIAGRLDVKYLIHLTEAAYPGLDWLKTAHDQLEATGKGFAAFNWGGASTSPARFAMVRQSWLKPLYGGALYFPSYQTRAARYELSAIARLDDAFLAVPDAVLIDIDEADDIAAPDALEADRLQLDRRFEDGFDGRFLQSAAKGLQEDVLAELHTDQDKDEDFEAAGHIRVIDMAGLDDVSITDPDGVAIIMPSINPQKARLTADLLLRRAGMPATVLIAEDTERRGFIATLNAVATRLDVKYVVYLAEDAFPGRNWLKTAHDRLESTGRNLLAFNCGKWRGRVAAFGMVRSAWVKGLYGGPVLFPGYKAHKADNELTVIARVTGCDIYASDAVLVEIDPAKIFRENVPEDKALFHERFRAGFDGLVSPDALRPYAAAYFVPLDKPAPVRAGKPASSQPEFVLHRIIGNDLYPRHKQGQSLDNLRFILEHEPELEGCEKRFVVNRIINPDTEREILAVLEESGHGFVHLPFEAEAYRAIGFDIDVFDEPGFLASRTFEQFEPEKKLRAKAALYRLKNNYVMNNNGARNAALDDGRNRSARWLMPFDGNCFLTAQSWQAIRSDIAAAPDRMYFIVPMSRMLSNDALIQGGPIPEPAEEPQIVFRYDATERFNESVPYGRRPKVELLWRLGVPGKWDTYVDDAWDLPRAGIQVDKAAVGKAGSVARLFSGRSEFEAHSEHATLQRGMARTQAVLATLRHLDIVTAGARPDLAMSVTIPAIARAQASGGKALERVHKQLLRDADRALERGPYSVIDKTTLPPSGDRQDYWHPAPYWWPDPNTADGLPYIRKDGERVPGTRLYEPGSEQYDRTRLQRVFDDTFMLALARQITGKNAYARHAAGIVRRFFIDPETRMNPHLKFGQVRLGHNGNEGSASGVIEMKDMYFFLDAVRLLHEQGALAERELNAMKAWLEPYMDWLLASRQGTSERRALNNHGTCYDLQLGSIAAFLGDTQTLYETLCRAQSRIAQQFDAKGQQPGELSRSATAHYCCYNLQNWVNLARLAGRWGVDLWQYEAPHGHSLKQGARWLLSHIGKPWPYSQIDLFDEERFLPIWFAARAAGVDGLPDLPSAYVSPLDVKPVFFPHDGVRPYWNLDVE